MEASFSSRHEHMQAHTQTRFESNFNISGSKSHTHTHKHSPRGRITFVLVKFRLKHTHTHTIRTQSPISSWKLQQRERILFDGWLVGWFLTHIWFYVWIMSWCCDEGWWYCPLAKNTFVQTNKTREWWWHQMITQLCAHCVSRYTNIGLTVIRSFFMAILLFWTLLVWRESIGFDFDLLDSGSSQKWPETVRKGLNHCCYTFHPVLHLLR